MLIKRRGKRIALYRSTWIPKGAGVPHGYSSQQYLGALPADATELPEALGARLTEEELKEVDARVCQPARQARQSEREEAERREHDPTWRLQEAGRLVQQAAVRSESRKVSRNQVDVIARELARVQVSEQGGAPAQTDARREDSLLAALKAIRAAAQAVKSGAYGRAPATGVRETRTYRLWADIVAAVDGDGNSLLRALQERGFAKSRR